MWMKRARSFGSAKRNVGKDMLEVLEGYLCEST